MNETIDTDKYVYHIFDEYENNAEPLSAEFSKRSIYLGALKAPLCLNNNMEYFEEVRIGKKRLTEKRSDSVVNMIQKTNMFPLLIKYEYLNEMKYATVTRTKKAQ